MIKVKKTVVAISFIVLGLIIFASAMTVYGWDFTKLSTSKYETNTYETDGDFESVLIDTDTANIIFLPTDEEKSKVVCYDKEKINHSVKVENGILKITKEKPKWYQKISLLDFKSPKITVYLSDLEYKELTVKSSTGDVSVSADFSFENVDITTSTGDVKVCASVSEKLKIKVSTGDIKVLDTSVGSLDTTGSTGDIELSELLVSGKISIERSTGDVEFDRCDAGEIWVKTKTGDVIGTLLSEKIFITRSDSGDIDVPETTCGGVCKIITDTGDIEITILD